jgi:hypothetical protein
MKRYLFGVLGVAAGLAVAVVLTTLGFRWIAHEMGWDSVTDDQYAFSSGSGFLVVVWLATVALWWARTSCRALWWCPLHGTHDYTDPETGVTRKLCYAHHPGVKGKNLGRQRLDEARRRHHLYLGDRPGKG